MTRLRIVSLVVGEDYDITKLKLTFVFQQHSMSIYIYRKFIEAMVLSFHAFLLLSTLSEGCLLKRYHIRKLSFELA